MELLCLGAPLARMELRLTLAAILRRMPDFKVDRERSKRFPEAGVVNGWLTMPAAFTPGRRLT
jgi:cytochrome P450